MTEFFQAFHFHKPYFLIIIPALITLFFILNKKQIIFTPNFLKLKKFASIENLKLLVRGNRIDNSKKINILLLIFFICLIIALARPRWGYDEIENYNYDKNLVILLDSSQSMAVGDIPPSRFTRAKQEVYDILNKYKDYRIGVISFTDIPYIISPLTKDHNAIINNLKSLSPDDFEIQGSNINEALNLTINYFKKVSGTEKYILLISDGDFTTKLDSGISKKILDQKLKLFIYAAGTQIGGPVFKQGKAIEYQGQKVISKLNIEKLTEIAKSLKGNISTISHNNLDIDEFNKFISQNHELTKNQIITKQWKERFYIFILPAMVILLVFFNNKVFLCLLIGIFLFNINNAHANIFLNSNQKATKHYNKKEYSKAESNFTDSYNKGVAAYKNKKYDDAIKHFKKTPESNIKAKFNQGNAYFMQQKFQDAINSYETVLKYDAKNKQAEHNLNIAKKMLKKQNSSSNNDNNNKNNESNNDKENKPNKDKKNDVKNNENKTGNNKEKQQNIDNNIFNLVETDSGTLLKKKIENKEKQNQHNKSNTKPW